MLPSVIFRGERFNALPENNADLKKFWGRVDLRIRLMEPLLLKKTEDCNGSFRYERFGEI